MGGFLEQCVNRYLELANISKDALKPPKTPSLDDQNFTSEDWTEKGTLAPIAASVLMKVVCIARCCRFDLLCPVCVLAREVTKWNKACDKQIHKLMCYINTTKDWNLESFIGDPVEDLKIVMYCDADFAGDRKDSKSTSGGVIALVGPNPFAVVSALSKKQSVVSHSSTEAEVVSLDVVLRMRAYQH